MGVVGPCGWDLEVCTALKADDVLGIQPDTCADIQRVGRGESEVPSIARSLYVAAGIAHFVKAAISRRTISKITSQRGHRDIAGQGNGHADNLCRLGRSDRDTPVIRTNIT